MQFRRILQVIAGGALALTVAAAPAMAQEDAETPPTKYLPVGGNPLKDLFTPQPQYVTPQTLANPQPQAPEQGESNPLKGLFTPQPQYLTPQAIQNKHPEPIEGEVNHFRGLYTPQPQFLTPQATINPEAEPRYYVPERLPRALRPAARQSESSEEDILQGHGPSEGGRAPGEEFPPGGERGSASAEPRSAEGRESAGAGAGGKEIGSAGKPAAGQAKDKAKGAEASPKGAAKSDLGKGATDGRAPLVQSAGANRSGSADPNHPLRKAMFSLRQGNYTQSLDQLNEVLTSNPKDAQAHYLLAVTNVMLRRYTEAANQYRAVLNLSQSSEIRALAETGLRKIGFDTAGK